MLCKKCGSENVDDAVFCTSCGANIEVENTCPSCGKEVQENAIYCNNCGARLDGKNVCSSCGELFEGNFCPKCGTSVLKKNQNNVAESKSVSGKQNKEKLNKIFDKTGTSILLFGVVFALIFVFLIGLGISFDSNIPKSSSIVSSITEEYGITSKVDITYYFGDVYKDLNDAIESGGYENLEVDYTSPILYINAYLGTVTAAGIITAVVVLSILAIISLIKKLCGKNAKKAERLASASIFTYFLGVLLLYAINYSSFNVSADKNYAKGVVTFNSATLAGIILCSICLGLALICYIIKNRESYKNLKNSIPSGIGLISSIFAVIVVAFASTGVFSYTTNVYGTELNLNTGSTFLSLQWAEYLQNTMPTTTPDTYILLMVFSVYQFVFVTLAVVSIIKQISNLLKNENKSAWGINIALMILAVAYFSLSVTIRNATYKEFDYSYNGDKLAVTPALIALVFSFLTLLTSVAQKVIPLLFPKVENKTAEING